MGCGYEPPAPSTIGVMTWEHSGRKPCRDEYDATGRQILNVCPGYLTTLPEVIDIARAHRHWTKGELTTFCRGDATDEMLIGVEIFEGACNEMQNWTMTPRDKGGGRD